MKKGLITTFSILIFLLFSGYFSAAESQTMQDYCQVPPSVSATTEANILLNIDVSRSMIWSAYNTDKYGYEWCISTGNCGGTYSGDEEGYFTPNAIYSYNPTGKYWEETTGTTFTGCPPIQADIVLPTSNLYSGSCLNFLYMSRIDVLRWAITGGNPASCAYDPFNPDSCDPDSGSSAGCDALGCTLLTTGFRNMNNDLIVSPQKVKVPWDRVRAGLAFQLKDLGLMPRIGAMFFSEMGVRTEKVYIGDYLLNNLSRLDAFPYRNLITHVNSTAPSWTESGTPTGPAMWDALNYFAQNSPDYNGFSPQTDPTVKAKNPMYVCDEDGANCELVPCTKNFVMLLSDGSWNSLPDFPVAGACSIDDEYNGDSADPVVPAYNMHMGFSNNAPDIPDEDRQTSVSAVYSIALFLGGTNEPSLLTGEQSLKNVAMYGSFYRASGARVWPSGVSGWPDDTCEEMSDCVILPSETDPVKGSQCEPLPDPSSSDWDKNNDKDPDTYYKASNAADLKEVLRKAIQETFNMMSSGTAASVLASGEGSGANMLQAVFYPKRTFFDDTTISWIGSIGNLWYYVDPFFTYSDIYEDNASPGVLDLRDDYLVRLFYDTNEDETKAKRYEDTTGDGIPDSYVNTRYLKGLSKLWDAGLELRERAPETRKIFTNCSIARFSCIEDTGLIGFSRYKARKLFPYMALPTTDLDNDSYADGDIDRDGNVDLDDATILIRYIRGEDFPDYGLRSRSVAITKGGTKRVWKLGDIVNSTPKIVSWSPLNTYDSKYKDTSYKSFLDSADYKDRGMVFAGANDGMLHAFKFGKLEMAWYGQEKPYQKARLINPDTNAICQSGDANPCGKEIAAFIPGNVLPYLKYIADPDYCHIYTVDLTPFVFDASIGCTASDYWNCSKYNSEGTPLGARWRTILIGGMRYGGACRGTNTICNDVSGDGEKDCVNTPVDVRNNSIGYSSYFALDITDTLKNPSGSPKLLWEFSDERLGFTTTGPAIVRISAKDPDGVTPDNTKNGRWFVVFGSGPTGPISTEDKQFMGRSDQDLRIFIIDLKKGPGENNGDVIVKNSRIRNAFASSMISATNDTDLDYQDDALYIGFTRRTGSGTLSDPFTWTDGGIGRLLTREDLDPGNWDLSKVIESNDKISIGPVTSSIARLQNKIRGELWIYAGTGRHFTKTDDLTGQRRIFGIKDPCFSTEGYAETCPAVRRTGLIDVTKIENVPTDPEAIDAMAGWFIDLDPSGDYEYPEGKVDVRKNYGAERVITDTVAVPTGLVFFTTYKPYTDKCSPAGKTFVWAVKYNTGGEGGSLLKGTGLLQVSTGSIERGGLSSVFTDSGGRKISAALEGMPPTSQGLAVQIPPPPVKRVLHMRER